MENLSIFEVFSSLKVDLDNNDRKWREIDKASFDYMLDVLPPLVLTHGGYLSPEPYTHLGGVTGVYLACIPLRGRFFAAYLTLQEFKSLSLSGIPKYEEK